jgi:hypothetical protein
LVKFGKKIVVYLKERKAKIFSLLYARKEKKMAQLTNSSERETAKQDRSGARTAEDVVRRIPDTDKLVVTAKQIELEGYTTVNGGFKIDETGNMECKNATVTGGNITMKSTGEYPNLILMDGNTLPTSNYRNEIHSGGMTVSSRESFYPYVLIGVKNGVIEHGGWICLYNQSSGMSIELDGEIGWIQGQMLSLYDSNMSTLNIDMDGTSGNITCVSLTQTSLAEKKKNFEKLENALDIVKDTDIYKYNFNFEEETDKKHIGFVIGDKYNYREEITSAKNDGAEIYSMISVLWKAVQEQQVEIEELRKLVNK